MSPASLMLPVIRQAMENSSERCSGVVLAQLPFPLDLPVVLQSADFAHSGNPSRQVA